MDERLYVVQDANYNVTALFDNAGNVVERYVYDPFGEATVLDGNWNVLAASAFAWIYLHQGGRFDATSGLYHFRFRDYSPTLGRWTSLDPLRYDAGDVNLYRYVFNGPTVLTDPSGQVVPLVVIGAIAVIGVIGISGCHRAAPPHVAPPTVQEVLGLPHVRRALDQAWAQSNPYSPAVRRGLPGSQKRGQSGWIIWNARTQRVRIVRRPAGTRDGCNPLPRPPEVNGDRVIAWFHTHPNINAEGYRPEPSRDDINLTRRVGVPGILISHDGGQAANRRIMIYLIYPQPVNGRDFDEYRRNLRPGAW